ncbi:MAG: UDP-N-acetylmuramoyl-L-alanyl-D-glutamate--2,6-diaminopimelate ligase, partial [Myxococcales bacterium]|nr:UDP-N-acetylmuramoyl-L-alanyl-D-glutamate--2,6-diaminopimelate ligase [Myxococcales bacterium]
MKLAALIAGMDGVALAQGDGAVGVRAVTHDSRAVGEGALYVALPGRRVHGRRFVDAAVAQGAAAIAVPAGEPLPKVSVPVITLAAPRPALAALAARLHGEPSRRLKLVGVTGTNGKT